MLIESTYLPIYSKVKNRYINQYRYIIQKLGLGDITTNVQ